MERKLVRKKRIRVECNASQSNIIKMVAKWNENISGAVCCVLVLKLSKLHAIATWVDQWSELGVRRAVVVVAAIVYIVSYIIFFHFASSLRLTYNKIRICAYIFHSIRCGFNHFGLICNMLRLLSFPLTFSRLFSFVSIREWKKKKRICGMPSRTFNTHFSYARSLINLILKFYGICKVEKLLIRIAKRNMVFFLLRISHNSSFTFFHIFFSAAFAVLRLSHFFLSIPLCFFFFCIALLGSFGSRVDSVRLLLFSAHFLGVM